MIEPGTICWLKGHVTDRIGHRRHSCTLQIIKIIHLLQPLKFMSWLVFICIYIRILLVFNVNYLKLG